MTEEAVKAKKKKSTKPKLPRAVYQLPDGTQITYKGFDKFYRDIIRNHQGGRVFENVEIIEIPDANNPIGKRPLEPNAQSPICTACGLDQTGCQNPYLEYVGTENPVATILVESVSRKEDDKGIIGAGGITGWMAALVTKLQREHGVSLDQIRWVPITRCAARDGKLPNYKTKGNWCRYYAIQDLMRHTPKVIIPVGTNVLGLLSHKTNAQDWSGRLLTWRGWPDNWLTDPDYVEPRPDPLDETKTVVGHPIFGPIPNVRIPMVPVQNPRIVLASQNEVLRREWEGHLIYALETGKKSIQPPDYLRPWYHISTDVEEIIATLEQVIAYAQHDPTFIVAYDTETTGLKQWAHFKRLRSDQVIRSDEGGVRPRIVFMMFRWTNPETGYPESIGFPWEFNESPLIDRLDELEYVVLGVLSTARIVGHNLVFDELFTISTVGRREKEYEPFLEDGKTWNPAWLWLQQRINMLAEAASADTWHMAFTALQRSGSLGLEILAYDYVPDLAGYEEEMTLLITLNGDEMDPANEKGGHYAMCPRHLWKSHLEPYVMGDVEVTYRAREALAARLAKSKTFKIPLSHPEHPGSFRYYQTPSRAWVYENVMVAANQTLTKMMARGMYISPEELDSQELLYPNYVEEAKKKLRAVDPAIEDWCKQKEHQTSTVKTKTGEVLKWELDLENKTLLKELLFDTLHCPIVRLTKKGRQLFGEEPDGWSHLSYEEMKEFAAVDKYTLNRLAVDHPNLRPLQEYRKVFKLYSTYVRPMRNMMAESLDKKQRDKDPHLSVDHCIHASFMLTGTRGGRLSCRDPNLQQLPNEGYVKRLFTSRFGDLGCIYAADLSQIELRLMAAACGDESMVHAYHTGIDIHSLTASKITWKGNVKIPYDHFTKPYMERLQHEGKSAEAKDLELKRKIAKTVNFLTGYGGGAFGLQNVLANNEVYMSLEECEAIIESFFAAYPMLKRFLGVYKTFIEDNAKAVSMFGRVRQFDEIYSEDNEARSKALRAGCNHLIQSTASDMMLICLFTIEKLMRDAGLKSLLVSTVHDSLVIDAVRSELSQVHGIVNWVMNHIPDVIQTVMPDYDTSWMIVPFAGDSEVGLNYLDTNKISGDNPNWDELLKPKQKAA